MAVAGAAQGVVQGPEAPAPPESLLETRPLLPACSGSRAPGSLNTSPETSLCSFPRCCLWCSFPTSLLPSHSAVNQEGRPAQDRAAGHDSSRENGGPQQVLREPHDGGRPMREPPGSAHTRRPICWHLLRPGAGLERREAGLAAVQSTRPPPGPSSLLTQTQRRGCVHSR